jgi:hypothetical protein
MKIVYIVIAYRFGDTERHSYTVACTTDFEEAKKIADQEEEYRGGKYCCCIEQAQLGYYDPEDDGPFIVFETPAFTYAQKNHITLLKDKLKKLASKDLASKDQGVDNDKE